MFSKNLREHLYGEVVRYKKYLYGQNVVLVPELVWRRAGRCAAPAAAGQRLCCAFQLYRAGGINLEQLMVLCATDDHALQESA